MKQSHLRRYVVNLSVSYMEIYKDEVYDLLVTRDNVGVYILFMFSCASSIRFIVICYAFATEIESLMQAPKLPVRENDHGKVFVANLSSIPISSVEEFDTIYAYVLIFRTNFHITFFG